MKLSSSLHCLMFLPRSTSLFIIPPHLYTQSNRDTQSDLLAPSPTFKLLLPLYLSDSTGFSPGFYSWHQPPLLLISIYLLPLQPISTTIPSPTVSSSQKCLIPLTSFPFQALCFNVSPSLTEYLFVPHLLLILEPHKAY